MSEATSLLSQPALRLGASTFTLGQALLAAGLLVLVLFIGLAWALWRAARARTAAAEEAAERTRAAEERMAGILQAQAEMKGSMGALAEVFGYFPDTGTFVPLTTSVSGNLSQMMYPALVLAVGFAANVMRTTRSAAVEVADADFIRTARGKGVSAIRIRVRHVLRNASVPIVTITGIQFGYLLGGTVIIEQIFALPGLGRLLFTSITDRDYPLVQSSVLVIAAGFVLVNLIVDLLYRAIDPRTRAA